MLACCWLVEAASAAVDAFDSPYRNQRRRAYRTLQEQLATQEPSQAAEELVRLLAADDPFTRIAAARALVVSPESMKHEDVVAAFHRETNPSVRAALLDVLMADERVSPEHLSGPADSPAAVAGRESRRLVMTRMQTLFETLMSDGSVPGFYDGQFQALWPLSDSMDELLLEIAHDPRYHFVVRVLSVMAMHESKRETLEADLADLILSEHEEFQIQEEIFFDPRPRSEFIIERRRKGDLSRYTRFSLAKAGKTKPIRDMIRRMDLTLQREEPTMNSRPPEGDSDWQSFEAFRGEWLRGLLFETGYYFQQFDDYDSAAERYRMLVDRFPESRSCQNAYYNLACIESIRNNKAEALKYLRFAVTHGFTDYEWLLEDGDLDPLRGDQEFDAVVELARTGQVQTDGSRWLATLVKFLPDGSTFFDLPIDKQVEILAEGGGLLSEAEIRSMREAAPEPLDPRLMEALRSLGYETDG